MRVTRILPLVVVCARAALEAAPGVAPIEGTAPWQ